MQQPMPGPPGMGLGVAVSPGHPSCWLLGMELGHSSTLRSRGAPACHGRMVWDIAPHEMWKELRAGKELLSPCMLRSSRARGSPGLGVAWGQQGRVPSHSPGRGQQWHRRGPSRTSQPIPSDNDRSCTADPSPGDTGVFPAQPAGRQSPVPSAGPGRASCSVPCCHPSHEALPGLAGVLDVLLAVCHQAQECFVRICAV